MPMNPEVSRLLEENFHRKYNPKPSDAEALIDDLQKLSLKKSVNEESEKPKDGEENTEKVETVETPVVQDTNQSGITHMVLLLSSFWRWENYI